MVTAPADESAERSAVLLVEFGPSPLLNAYKNNNFLKNNNTVKKI